MTAAAIAFPSAVATSQFAAEVDELGRIDAQLAPLKPVLKRQKELKDILADYGLAVIEGDDYLCTVATTTEDRLDTASIRVEMGADWCLAYTKTGTKRTVRTAAKPR